VSQQSEQTDLCNKMIIHISMKPFCTVLLFRKEREHLKDKGVDRIMKWIFKKWDGRLWTGFMWLTSEPVVGCCVYGNEPLGSVKRKRPA